MTYFDTKNIKNKTAVWFRQHQPLIKQGLPIVAALAIVLVGYVYVKNIKTEQLASAEQVAGSPESGAKSRISELYDALVAQNKGSDTDVSGLTVAQGDWGAKWNRIKTAALKGGSQGSGQTPQSYGVFRYNPNDPEVDFADGTTGIQWSWPLSVEGGKVVAKKSAIPARWTFDSTGSSNRSVGGKTSSNLCRDLGNSWVAPHIDIMQALDTKMRSLPVWGSTESWSDVAYSPGGGVHQAYSHRLKTGEKFTRAQNHTAYMVCVRR